MKCRPNCGACCIIPSISSPIPGMPDGKPAGVRCIHLTEDLQCGIFNSNERPWVCGAFESEHEVCGDTRQEAIHILSMLMEEMPIDEKKNQ